MKRVAIAQSNYIPWKGYFDLIAAADEFILLDDVQFTKNDWRNRNRIKGPDGLQWLTVPVRTKGRFGQTIAETEVSQAGWAPKHWRAITQNYAATSYIDRFANDFGALFEAAAAETHLSVVNRLFIERLCGWLGIETQICRSYDYSVTTLDRVDRVVQLCQAAGATHYISGPSARKYIPEGRFADAGITLEFADYSFYPTYEQPYPPFHHGVSIIDLILCVGDKAPEYMYFSSGMQLGITAETPGATKLGI